MHRNCTKTIDYVIEYLIEIQLSFTCNYYADQGDIVLVCLINGINYSFHIHDDDTVDVLAISDKGMHASHSYNTSEEFISGYDLTVIKNT